MLLDIFSAFVRKLDFYTPYFAISFTLSFAHARIVLPNGRHLNPCLRRFRPTAPLDAEHEDSEDLLLQNVVFLINGVWSEVVCDLMKV